MKRRAFLKIAGGVAGSVALGIQPALYAQSDSAQNLSEKVAGMPRRVLGRTGLKVSVAGYPGLAMTNAEQDECNKSLRRALDMGVNYFDVAPAYGNGVSETRMGIAFEGIGRDQYLLACKTKMRDRKGAREELERSLTRLKTDHFDVYQFHHLRFPDEVKQIFGPDGAMETFQQAKKEGKIRFVGFSAHTTKGALLAMEQYKFDTVMFPISYVDYFNMGFGKPVLELADKQGAAVLAIKIMSGGVWKEGEKRHRQWWYRTLESQEDIDRAFRFTLSLKPVVMGISPSFTELADKSFLAGHHYQPASAEDVAKLQEMAAGFRPLFEAEEKRVAMGSTSHSHFDPESPYDTYPCCRA